jgi:large subunit ribosomal protein L9
LNEGGCTTGLPTTTAVPEVALEVILRKQVDKLGVPGDRVRVSPGYARNYLVPRGLAYPASDASALRVAQEKRSHEARQARMRDEARKAAERLQDLSLTFVERAGDEDQLYGSVSAERIAEKLAELGYPVQRRHVQLHETIKTLGVYPVEVRLDPEAAATVKVWVVKE